MKRLVVIPADSTEALVKAGYTYEFLENYYNPGGGFDQVYCLGAAEKDMKTGSVCYVNAKPKDFGANIRRVHPDIVRAYGGNSSSDWAEANCIKDIPLVVSVHDTNPNLIYGSLKYADYIICMSEGVKKEVQKQIKIGKDRIFVMPNRIDTKVFCKREDQEAFRALNQKYGNGKHIIHVGRKAEQKNLDTLIRSLTYLPEEYSAVFIGRGDTEPYEKMAEKYEVSGRCFFVDRVKNEKLPIYYSWGDCMCTPSRWEGFGIVFLEAAACECAIVTSNIAPMNEYLTDGADAILIDQYEDPKVLAEGIMRACIGGKKRMEMKKNARNISLKFDKSNVDRQEMELYKKFMQQGTDNRKFFEVEKERERLTKKLIIFGAGTNGRRLLEYVGKDKVAYFCDNRKTKIPGRGYTCGVKIISYSEMIKIYKDYNIVVTPMDKKEMVMQLMGDGIEYMEDGWYRLLNEQKAQSQ